MIEIQNLNKAFEQHVIFKDFNLTIQEGSFVVFCGESGCGKTTLLNMIGGLEPVDKGEILVNKKNIALNRNLRNYLQYEVGFLFQNFLSSKLKFPFVEKIPQQNAVFFNI